MERPAILVAVAPAALDVVRELLGEEFDLVPVRTLGEALERLARGGIGVILGGLHFDDSLMPILLDAVKAHPATRDIPFVDVLEIQQREGAEAAAERLRCALQRRCLGLSAP